MLTPFFCRLIALGMDFYTEVLDMSHLLEEMNERFDDRFRKLNAGLCELIEDFNLVSFVPLDVSVSFYSFAANATEIVGRWRWSDNIILKSVSSYFISGERKYVSRDSKC